MQHCNRVLNIVLVGAIIQFSACALTESYPEQSVRGSIMIPAESSQKASLSSQPDFRPAQTILADRREHAIRHESYSPASRTVKRPDYPQLTDTEIVEARAQLKSIGASASAPTTAAKISMPSKEANAAPKRVKGGVAPGYLVQIVALEDEKLNGRFRVSFNGSLKLPYGVTVDTSGLSEQEMATAITKAYRKYFRADPSLQISIVERDLWVDVRGLVKESGKFLVKEDTSLDELLAKAGGLQRDQASNALAQYVRVNQLGTDTALINLDDYYAGSQFQIPHWQGGDTVFAQTRKPQLESDARAQFGGAGASPHHIQLVGQVKHPGKFAFKEDADFFYYLVQAGGPTEKADLNRLFVVREENGVRTNTRVDLETLDNMPMLQAGDLLILNGDVPGAAEKQLDFLGSVSDIVTSIASVAVLAFAL